MSLYEIRVPLQQVKVKKGTSAKNGNEYYYVEVLEPVRKFLQPDNPKIAMILSQLADDNNDVDLNTLFVNNNFIVDEKSIIS